jgi:S1-C subfamily serine protease
MARNKSIAIALMASVTGACVATSALAKTATEIFAEVSPSVWVVNAAHADKGVVAQGSAVVIGPRRLVTACHVVNGANAVTVTHSKAEMQVAILRTTSDPDPEKDMCVLTTTEDIGAPPVTVAPISTVKVGNTVYAIGSPLGLELTLTNGLVSALRTDNNGKVQSIQSSAAVSHGSSGGGLFDDQGRLIGVTVAAASETTEALNFALPAQALIDLPERREAAIDTWRMMLEDRGIKFDGKGNAVPSGFAAIEDVSKLPAVGPAQDIKIAYQQFLLKAHPRAFIVTSDGQWGTVTSAETMMAILAQCQQRKVQCALYAVDDAVVWAAH